MGLFGALHIGSQALLAQQKATEVTGHNIANVNTPGYSKQRADFVSKQGIGSVTVQGTEVFQISRAVDVYLTNEIRDQGSRLNSFSVQSDYVKRVEEVLNTFEDTDIATALDQFFVAAQDLSNNSEDVGYRDAYLSAADLVAFRFNQTAQQLEDLQAEANTDVENVVSEINNITTQIASLNIQIVEQERGGPAVNGRNANDLRDQRDELLRQLGEKIPITVHEQSTGSVVVNVLGDNLIQDGIVEEISTIEETVNGVIVKSAIFKDNLAPLTVHGLGELGGIYEGRDTLIGGTLTDINTLATGFMDAVNAIQTTGFGLSGYDSLTSWESASATNVPFNSSGLSRSVTNGGFNIQVRETDGTLTPIYVQVDVDTLGAETTIDSLVLEINQKLTAAGITDISASIDNNNFVSLASTGDRTFSFTDDTSGALNALGWGTLFDGADAVSMAVNQTIRDNVDFVATGLSTDPADNTNILNIVNLRDQKIFNAGSETIEENNLAILSNVGTNAARLSGSLTNQEALVQSLQNERQERIGVNLDTEVIDLMKFQHAYEGAARFVSVIDELLDTVINRLF